VSELINLDSLPWNLGLSRVLNCTRLPVVSDGISNHIIEEIIEIESFIYQYLRIMYCDYFHKTVKSGGKDDPAHPRSAYITAEEWNF
jgi:hypothetical protein